MITKRRNLRVLDNIASLEDDWNYNGAPAFSKEHIKGVRKIVKKLSKKYQPFIGATACRSIHFELDDAEGNHLQFEIFEDMSMKVFYCTPKMLDDYFENHEDACIRMTYEKATVKIIKAWMKAFDMTGLDIGYWGD